MADIPLLERLAQLPALPATAAVALLERLAQPHTDPVIGAFFGVDDDGDAVVNALVPTALQQFKTTGELTCYGALLEGLTGICHVAVRAVAVARLRCAGLRPDHPRLKLQLLSARLGLA